MSESTLAAASISAQGIPARLRIGGFGYLIYGVLTVVAGAISFGFGAHAPDAGVAFFVGQFISYVGVFAAIVASIELARGRLAGGSVFGMICLTLVAAAWSILIIASVLVFFAGVVLELLFPLGGTLLTLSLLGAGIVVVVMRAVDGYARWAIFALGLWQLLGDLPSFLEWNLQPFASVQGPGWLWELGHAVLLIAAGVAIVRAARRLSSHAL